jgi:hypothetical protein
LRPGEQPADHAEKPVFQRFSVSVFQDFCFLLSAFSFQYFSISAFPSGFRTFALSHFATLSTFSTSAFQLSIFCFLLSAFSISGFSSHPCLRPRPMVGWSDSPSVNGP